MDFSIKKNNSIVLVASVILMTAALFARDLYGASIGRTMFIALSVLPAVVMNYQSLVYYIFFLFSLTSGLPGNYIFPLLIITLMAKRPNSFNRDGLVCFAIVVLMELMHYVTYSFPVSWSSTVGYFCDLFFLFYFVTLKEEIVDIKRCILYFCAGLAVFLFAIFYITQINGSFEMLLEESGRIGYTKSISGVEEGTMMLNANPNGLGFFSIIGIASIIVLYIKKKVNLWVMIGLAALYVFVGALGVSRTFLYALIIMMVLLLLFARSDLKRATFGRYFLLFVAIIAGVYILTNTSLLYNAYNSRLTAESMDTLGSRTTVFADYNSYLFNHPLYLLFGTGAVHYGSVISEINLSTHNGLQQVLVSYGVIGLLFFLYITVKAVKVCYKKGSPVSLVPFLIAFLYVQTGQLLTPSYNLYLFVVSFYVIKLSRDFTSKA
ncbi:MAG: hypothetical protein IJ604_00150 [Prevotella sp.]|nr:hypothetical protein [Prevotella sp.]